MSHAFVYSYGICDVCIHMSYIIRSTLCTCRYRYTRAYICQRCTSVISACFMYLHVPPIGIQTYIHIDLRTYIHIDIRTYIQIYLMKKHTRTCVYKPSLQCVQVNPSMYKSLQNHYLYICMHLRKLTHSKIHIYIRKYIHIDMM